MPLKSANKFPKHLQTPATVATPAPTVTPVDWIQFHGGNGGFHLDTNTKPKSYVGPIAVHEFEGRGLGLVATRKITAGEVLLIEDAFAMSSTCGALISQATAELARTCCKQICPCDTSRNVCILVPSQSQRLSKPKLEGDWSSENHLWRVSCSSPRGWNPQQFNAVKIRTQALFGKTRQGRGFHCFIKQS